MIIIVFKHRFVNHKIVENVRWTYSPPPTNRGVGCTEEVEKC